MCHRALYSGGRLRSDPVVHRTAIAPVAPIGLVCCKHPVVRCDCNCWCTDRVLDDSYGALCEQGDAINGVECGVGNAADALFCPVDSIKKSSNTW